MQIDLFIDPLATANGKEWRIWGIVCQLVCNSVVFLVIQRNEFCFGVVSNAQLYVRSLQRQERYERTDKVPVNHAAVLQTTCVQRTITASRFEFSLAMVCLVCSITVLSFVYTGC